MTDNPLTDQELAQRRKAKLARLKIAKRTAKLLRQCGFVPRSYGFNHPLLGENHVVDPTMHDFKSISDVVEWVYNYGRKSRAKEIRDALGL